MYTLTINAWLYCYLRKRETFLWVSADDKITGKSVAMSKVSRMCINKVEHLSANICCSDRLYTLARSLVYRDTDVEVKNILASCSADFFMSGDWLSSSWLLSLSSPSSSSEELSFLFQKIV